MTLSEVRVNYNMVVIINDSEYILRECIESRDIITGELKYKAMLQDKNNNNSIVYCDFEQIEKKGDKNDLRYMRQCD